MITKRKELTHKEKVHKRAWRDEVWESLGFFLIMFVAAIALGVIVHPVFGGLVGLVVGIAMFFAGAESSRVAIDEGRYSPESRGR